MSLSTFDLKLRLFMMAKPMAFDVAVRIPCLCQLTQGVRSMEEGLQCFSFLGEGEMSRTSCSLTVANRECD